ncbi:MAG: hypothetical protein FIB05_11505 [Betaproteobacteria bacterium]|nr:hypothetical protein [Betaproteobacteria bacterium]PWB58784.1 MAG: hypothetical protein C3F16_13170 [Betaproteobacteria bacterium]
MTSPTRTRDERTLFAAAAACAALVFVVVASSAWLRLVAAPCPPGGCAEFGPADAVRLAHRVAAMGVTVLALLVAALSWKAPSRPGLRAASVVLIVLVAALAIVGRRSAGAAPPAIQLANLLGGLALLGTCSGLAAAAPAARGRVALPFAGALALLLAAIASGGVLSIVPPATGSPLALGHRGLSWLALAAWGLIALSAAPAPAARLLARVAALCLAGIAVLSVAGQAGPVERWLHNLLSSVAIAAAVAGTLRARIAAPGPELPERAYARP